MSMLCEYNHFTHFSNFGLWSNLEIFTFSGKWKGFLHEQNNGVCVPTVFNEEILICISDMFAFGFLPK